MIYAIVSKLRLLAGYGWPARALQTHEKCQLHSDIHIRTRDGDYLTTDDTGSEALHRLGIENPLVFTSKDSAVFTIEMFNLPNARVVPWRY